MGLFVFSLPISLVTSERKYIYFVLSSSSNRRYELTLFRLRAWNGGMQCMSHYILMDISLCIGTDTENTASSHGNAFCITSHVRGIWSEVDFTHKGKVMQSFDILFICLEQAVEQPVEMVTIFDAMTLIWRRSNRRLSVEYNPVGLGWYKWLSTWC